MNRAFSSAYYSVYENHYDILKSPILLEILKYIYLRILFTT